MKYANEPSQKRILWISALIFCIISIPNVSSAQKGGSKNDVYIMVSCTEFIGDGKVVAYFGYENTGKKPVVVDETGSVITYNYGQSKKYGLYTFEPGVNEKAFSQEFDSKDRVQWTVIFPDGTTRTTDANIHSNHCKDAPTSLNIIPGYNPPEGGKEYNSKIGAELTALYNLYDFNPANLELAPEDIFRLDETKVLIEVVALNDQYDLMISNLVSLGFDQVTADPELYHATGWLEIGDLLQLNDMVALYYARPVYPGVSNYFVPATGLTKSQGDFAMHSDFARLGYNINGSGVKIGVLSNSFNTKGVASQDVGNGDLPGAGNPNGFTLEVDVLKDIIPTNGPLSDEGRAMLQIVHDIAPGAELAFRTGYLGEQDMADGIRELAGEAGCDIIVDDLSYITEPFFRDGVVSQAIDQVVGEGVTFFSSAGNFANASYTSIFNPFPAPSTIHGEAHNFGGGDIFQNISLEEGSYTLVLQWDDGSDPTMNTTATDLDIFLSDDIGFSLLGFNRENAGGFPIEVVPFSVLGDDVNANIVVARASGPGDATVNFKYILFRGGTQFHMNEYGGGSSTIVGHPNAAGAITVGAVRFDKNPVYSSPTDYPLPVIMSFSSMGGTPLMGVTPGTLITRNKPDITAPNGVNTTVNLGNGDWNTDTPEYPVNIDPDIEYPNFFGTSAASPHAAGMAALIIQAKTKFDPEHPATPVYIRDVMKSTALEMENPGNGYNYVSGSGFIQAHKALMTFANPTPYVENLILAAESGVPGSEITPFSFTLTGDFFTDQTQVLFRGEPLDAGVVVVDESTIHVEHPGFLGNPVVQAYNPVISESGLDGGASEGIYFSDPIKLTVLITAGNLTKKFGEVLPDYTASIRVETVDETLWTLDEAVSEGIMLQEEADRLSGLTFATAAETDSDAGQYIIEPSLYPELFADAQFEEVDHAISEKYILEMINGTLTIEKLALKITPMDVEMVYGEQLPGESFDFLYEIEDPDIENDQLEHILNVAKQEHLSTLTNEVALVRGIALVNGIPMVRGIALVNGVTLVRGIALVNGVEVKVEVDADKTTVYVDGEPVANGATLVRGIALVNGLPFVNMTEIVRGIALVNGNEITFEDGFMTELNAEPLTNKVAAVRGIALVNGITNARGIALVNGVEVIIDENGVTTIDGETVPTDGIVEINGIPVVRGIALVNSSTISSGIALVNDIEVPIENGIPIPRGIALVNGDATARGIALVNGIPMIRGIALVNSLEVIVENGMVNEVFENGVLVNGLTMSRGIALVNEVALVNGDQLIDSGTASINGIALVNEAAPSEDLVSLENMNFLASGATLDPANLNGINVRGIALVNGIEGVDGTALKEAAEFTPEDGSIVYENVTLSRGIALVNGLAYVRGIALVNTEDGTIPVTSGTPVVNGSDIDDISIHGTIMVFDATDIGTAAESISFTPISFITGTTAGQHWIIPGTFLSDNFDISYGLGTLTIDPAEVNVTPVDPILCINEGDPLPDFTFDYEGWKTGDTGNEGYTVLRETDGAEYDPLSDESSGTYIVTPVPYNTNYTFKIEPGILYVNPYGPGTRTIKPVLNCVQEIDDYYFIANFEYKNENEVAVYIPVSEDNLLTGNNIFWDDSDKQPTLFLPGGGTFQIYFDGQDLSWTVNSRDQDQKVSNAANANSSSTKCKNIQKSASVSGEFAGELDPDYLVAYPNPVAGKVHITMKDIEHYKMILFYDFAGRLHPITSITKHTDNLEIDMAQLSAGYYFIKIIMDDTARIIPVIKQ
jgi:hypothetical protein